MGQSTVDLPEWLHRWFYKRLFKGLGPRTVSSQVERPRGRRDLSLSLFFNGLVRAVFTHSVSCYVTKVVCSRRTLDARSDGAKAMASIRAILHDMLLQFLRDKKEDQGGRGGSSMSSACLPCVFRVSSALAACLVAGLLPLLAAGWRNYGK